MVRTYGVAPSPGAVRRPAARRFGAVLGVALLLLLAVGAGVLASPVRSALGQNPAGLASVSSTSSAGPTVPAPSTIAGPASPVAGLPVRPAGDASGPGPGPAAVGSSLAMPFVTSPPNLTASPSSGPVGTAVTFSATHFAHGAKITISIVANKKIVSTVCSGTTSLTGAFSCVYIVPPTPGGAETFTATDAKGNSASTTFTIVPHLTVSPASGPVGTIVLFSGTGFGGTPTLTFGVQIAWSEGLVCSTQTNHSGSFSCSYTIPPASAGGHTFYANSTTISLKATAVYSVVPTLTAGPNHGPEGTSVTFAGTGFGPGVPAQVTWTAGTACTTLSTFADGSFSCSYVIPAGTAGGVYTFTGSDTQANHATTPFTVTYLRPSPSTATVGTSVTVSGGGFAPTTAITVVTVGLGSCAGTGTTRSDGTYTCTLTVPPATAGVHLISASDAVGESATAPLTVQPKVAVSPSYGPATGQTETFAGAGFAGGAAVYVNWTYGVACTATTSAVGSFNCTFALAPSTPGGTYIFTAEDTQGNAATTTYVVTFVTTTPTSVSVGSSVRVSAGGFTPSASYSVTFDSTSKCSGKSSTTGTFACTFSVPATVAGPHTISASTGSLVASTTLTVLPAVKATPPNGTVGTSVALAGTGFAGSSSVALAWDGTPICPGTATSTTGSFSCSSFAVPDASDGFHAITATDTQSDTATFMFLVGPSLVLVPPNATVGTVLAVTATGFSPSVPLTITWIQGTVCSGPTTSVGTFSCAFTLPPAPFGHYKFTAVDGNSVTVQSKPFGVIPTLAVGPTSGPVGSLLTFTATGFNASASVTVSWSAGTACSAVASLLGSFQCLYTLPAAGLGTYTFTARSSAGSVSTGTQAVATTSFAVVPSLRDSPTSGLAGTTVAFTGAGFPVNTAITVNWSGGTACALPTGATGSFGCSFTIPLGTLGGTYTFTAEDAAHDQASAVFHVNPRLTASPNHGPPSTAVTFTGIAFPSNLGITLAWLGGTVCSTTTDGSGGFSCPFTIPAATPGGPYVFTATDSQSDTATVTFVVTYLTTDPGGATAGSSIELHANGFASNSTLSITWLTSTVACSGTTDANGTLVCSYLVPSNVAPGAYTFTAEDGSGNTASAPFTVFGVPSVTSPSPSRASADVGQSVTFSTTASGGSGTYPTYTWSAPAALGCILLDAASITCEPTASGNATVSVTVTDSNGVTSPSASTTFEVFPTLEVAAPTASVASADVGQSVSFTVSSSGGSGGTTYAWTGLPVGCSASGATASCSSLPASGTLSVSATGTDSNGLSSTSPALAFTVYPDPTVATPSANRTSADVGQAVTFSVTAAGGSGGLGYAWSGLPTGCSGTSPTVACTPTAAVTDASITVTVTDSNGFAATSSALTFTVYADPSVAVPSANRTSADVGQAVAFTASPSLGSGGFTFSWTGLPSGCTGTTSAVVDCAGLTTARTFEITVTVTDSNGFEATSGTLSFTVYPAPVIQTPTVSPPSADVGQSASFAVTVSGGSGGTVYNWSGLPGGCTASDASASCPTLTTDGTFTVEVTAVDSNGFSVTSPPLTFVVSTDPTVGVPTANRTSVDVGQAVLFSVTASGGSGGLTYTWAGLPPGCSGTGSSITCHPTGAVTGTSVKVRVTDSNGFIAISGALVFTVYADPVVSGPTPSVPSLDLGQSVNISVGVTGGSGGLEYSWTGLPSGCSSTAGAASCPSIATTGTFAIQVTVVDSNNFSAASSVLELSVYSDPTVSAPTASRASADVDQSVIFSTSASGGSGGYSYAWLGLPPGCAGTAATLTCSPSASVTDAQIRVKVTDSNGFAVTSSALHFTVFSRPDVTLTVAPGSVLAGHSVSFTGTVQGGSGGLTYAWVGLPSGCSAPSGPNLTCSPSSAGSYRVNLTVTDSNGISSSANVRLSVEAQFLGLPAVEGYAVVGGAAAAVVIALLVVLLLRRRRHRPPPPAPWTPEAGEAAPAGGEALFVPPSGQPLPETSEEPSPLEPPQEPPPPEPLFPDEGGPGGFPPPPSGRADPDPRAAVAPDRDAEPEQRGAEEGASPAEVPGSSGATPTDPRGAGAPRGSHGRGSPVSAPPRHGRPSWSGRLADRRHRRSRDA